MNCKTKSINRMKIEGPTETIDEDSKEYTVMEESKESKANKEYNLLEADAYDEENPR